MAVTCSKCYRPVSSESISSRYAWCPHCARVFRVSYLLVPEWMFGIVGVLVLNLYANF